MMRDDGVGFGPQRRGQHPPGAVARDLGQRIVHVSGQVEAG
jgi:signal transduction histidine kinase